MILRVPRPAVVALAAALAAALLPYEAAQAQADNNFFGNLFKPPGQVGGGQAASPAVGGEDPGELTTRIDRLENQLRQMTGQLEQLQYRNQQLEQQVKRFQEEFDYRMGGAGGSGSPAPRANPAQVPSGGTPSIMAPPVAPGGPAPAKRSDAFDPNAQPAAPGAPRPLGTTPPSEPVNAGAPGAPMDLGSGAPAGAPSGGTQVATLPPSNSPKDMYDLAYGYVLRQDYVQATREFETFVQQYPTDRAAPDAYYWLGESNYQRQLYKEAAQSFLKVSTDYPNAVKAPDALLRLGQSLAAIGEKDAACATFNAIGNKYPRASATVRQGVEREQKRVRC